MSRYIFFTLYIFITFNICAQPELNFVRYTTQQGLVSNDVLCIYQDSYGFTWFGTKYGCSRFDGIQFKTYQFNEDISGAIGPGWVTDIVGDNNNRLWFTFAGHGSTFMKYDYETDRFVDISANIKLQLHLKEQSLNFWNIYPDSEGHIWLSASNCGFMYYNPENNKIKELANPYITQQTLPSINDFFEDTKKNIWFATSQGIFIYNKKTGLFRNYRNVPNNVHSLSSDNCNKIFHDSEGQIWIGTYNGLNKLISFSVDSLAFERFVHNPKNLFTLSNNLVYDIAEYNNNLLIATVNGLCLLNKKSEKIYSYYNSEIDNESINSNLVRSMYCDNQNNIWIATNSGIGKLQVKNFKSFSQSAYKNSISHNKVQYLCESPNSDVWIATPKGIDILNKKTGVFQFIAGITRNEKGLYGGPLVLCSDKEKGMWVGTWNGGLSYVKYSTEEIVNYVTQPITQDMLNIFAIFMDNKSNLWIAVSGKGIYIYDKKTGIYKIISHDSQNENTLSSNRVLTIMEDSDGKIWIGTLDGLNLLMDIENSAFKCYLSGVEIKYIAECSDNNLWIGSTQGLYQFNKNTQKFKKFDINDGIPGNSVFGILEDSSQNIWISTNNGLASFKLFYDSISEIITYRQEDGISVGEFLDRSCVKLSDGTMMFGGTEGFCMFRPEEIKKDTLPPKIIFTNLKVANKTVLVNQKINNQVILQKSIIATRELTLNHKNNTFSIEFAGLQYNMPQYNQYCYTLEGYDKDDEEWHYTNSDNRNAEYMNLPKGSYTFKVKSANSYGVWNNKPAELKITILPPWWQTFWFKSLVTIVLISLVILIIRVRTYNLQKQKQTLKKLVEKRTEELKETNLVLSDRTEELEQQMDQMERLNKQISDTNKELLNANKNLEIKTIQVENMAKQLHEADQSKLQFFANISHEFRTPLSLIIGPLEKLISLKQPILWDKTNISDYHQLMLKNAKRLFRLINQVIDFRKIESKEKKLNLSNSNIVEFTKEVIDTFSAQAEQKRISLKLESQYPTFEFWFDSDIMEKILYNLISNAIKYTPEQGEISVQLSVTSNQSYDSPLNTDNCLLITVKDTGIGIQKENLDKIFDRFYRVEDKENFAEGTGIGLAYTKELVELHKGTIAIESEYGKGTAFTLQFSENEGTFNKKDVNKGAPPIHLDYIRSMIETNEDKSDFFTNEKYFDDDNVENKLQEKPNILIVEDNADLRKFIKNELSSHFNVNEAANGEKGLELAVKKEPDLIISDIMMPVMDGIELCKKIKSDENTSHIPLILLTAKGSDNDQIKGLETGADDYITKPFNINILKIKIRNILLARKHMQEKFSNTLDVVPSEVTSSILDQKFLLKAIETINNNIQNSEFDNDTFVSAMNNSRALVYRKIKNLTGQSVSDFIRNIRLKAAAKLFLEGNNNVTDVCYKVGFKYPNHFAVYFNKMFGKPPREFIKDTLKE